MAGMATVRVALLVLAWAMVFGGLSGEVQKLCVNCGSAVDQAQPPRRDHQQGAQDWGSDEIRAALDGPCALSACRKHRLQDRKVWAAHTDGQRRHAGGACGAASLAAGRASTGKAALASTLLLR